jgi:hypothetical protein
MLTDEGLVRIEGAMLRDVVASEHYAEDQISAVNR